MIHAVCALLHRLFAHIDEQQLQCRDLFFILRCRAVIHVSHEALHHLVVGVVEELTEQSNQCFR